MFSTSDKCYLEVSRTLRRAAHSIVMVKEPGRVPVAVVLSRHKGEVERAKAVLL